MFGAMAILWSDFGTDGARSGGRSSSALRGFYSSFLFGWRATFIAAPISLVLIGKMPLRTFINKIKKL